MQTFGDREETPLPEDDKPDTELSEDTPMSVQKGASKDLWMSALAKVVAISIPVTGSLVGSLLDIRSIEFSPTKRAEKRKTLAEEKAVLVKELIESGIDPAAFDVLISNEINRKLKVQFGIVFLVLTFIFTAASYSIVILDGVFEWNISQVAITALIIETPIQFIGLFLMMRAMRTI